jgi:hypothetical protein
MKYTAEITPDGMTYHVCTKFNEDWLGHAGNIEVIASTIREAAVLVLLMN